MTKDIKTSGPDGQEFVYELKVPKDRVAALIGEKGKTKRALEKLTDTKLQIDSKEGDVTILGKEALSLYTSREIVTAIARGFAPDVAKGLIKQDTGFEVLNIKDYAKSDNDIRRLRGRVIGEEGKSRRVIEELTGVHVSVYGKTVGFIGDVEELTVARRAVEALLAGRKHATVFKWLEDQRRRVRERQLQQGGF